MALTELEFFETNDFGSTTFHDHDTGVVFTPIERAVELILPTFEKQKNDELITILEPSSGVGNLIIATIIVCKMLKIPAKRVRIYSVELDPVLMQRQRNRLKKHFKSWESRVEFFNSDFLFDFKCPTTPTMVLMNPPWVGYKNICTKTRARIKARFQLRGQFDLLDPFVLKAHELVSDSGAMLMFLPDKVISSHQPSNSLHLLADRTTITRTVQLPISFYESVQHESLFVELRNGKLKNLLAVKAKASIGVRLSDLFTVFRGLELSGRNSEYITTAPTKAIQKGRPFVSGQEMSSDGKLSRENPRFVSSKIPPALIKSHFDYEGPSVLVRKTGSPVRACFAEKMPFFSQVVFALVPAKGTGLSKQDMVKIADYLRSQSAQTQFKRNSGKLGRNLFPYITIGDLKNIQIDLQSLGITVKTRKAAS